MAAEMGVGVGTVYRVALEGSKSREKAFLNVPPVRKTGSQHDTRIVTSFVTLTAPG
jgi:hypothetical protein